MRGAWLMWGTYSCELSMTARARQDVRPRELRGWPWGKKGPDTRNRIWGS